MPTVAAALPTLPEQAERLIELDVHRTAGLPAERLRRVPDDAGSLLVVHPDLAPASALVPLLRLNGKPGFVVTDMADVDEFTPIAAVRLPDAPVYVVRDPDRGDAMANWSPDEALPAIADAGRTPLTLTEGLHWLLQRPDVLARGRCFMTIASRRRKPDGSLDARTPAVWISNGTGRDGPPTATRRRSAGAGREIGIRGSDSPRPVSDSPSTDRVQPPLLVRYPYGCGHCDVSKCTSQLWRSTRTPCAASTNGRTASSHATGSDAKTTWPVGRASNLDPGMAAWTALPHRGGAVTSLAPQVISTGALIAAARVRRSCPGSVKLLHSAAAVRAPASVLARATDAVDDGLIGRVLGPHVRAYKCREHGLDHRRDVPSPRRRTV